MSGAKLSAGRVIRIRHMHDPGEPEEVKISAAVARRCKWLREQIHGDLLCDVFRDPSTEEVYIDPEGREPDLSLVRKLTEKRKPKERAATTEAPSATRHDPAPGRSAPKQAEELDLGW